MSSTTRTGRSVHHAGTTVGLDLAKNVFQVHGANSHGKVVLRKQLRRDQVAAFFANLPASLIGMEACSSAHHLHRLTAVCERYVQIALGLADFSAVKALAIDETSRARGHDYITLAADALARRVLFVTEGCDAKAIEALVADLDAHGCPPEQIESVSIDMSPAFIKGCQEQLPNARITFDKFHVVWHASTALDKMRRIEQRSDKSLKGMRWSLLKDRSGLKPEAAADLDALIARFTRVRTARAWLYKKQLREILGLRELLAADASPLLFHCTAGKDRTGFAAAIVLLALEVPQPAIEVDFLRSNDHWRPTRGDAGLGDAVARARRLPAHRVADDARGLGIGRCLP